MIGIVSLEPNDQASTGSNMIDAPNPTTPPIVPAATPKIKMTIHSTLLPSPGFGHVGALLDLHDCGEPGLWIARRKSNLRRVKLKLTRVLAHQRLTVRPDLRRRAVALCQ